MKAPTPLSREGFTLPTFLGRALMALGAMLFLGFGLGFGVQQGASALWILGLLASLALVVLLMARWQLRPLAEPLGLLLGGTRPHSIDDLPSAWTALERENFDLKERAFREDWLLPGIMTRLEEGVLLFGANATLEQFNPAAQRHLGLSTPLSIGMSVSQVIRDPEGIEAIQRAYRGSPVEWRLGRAGRTLRVRAIPFAPRGAIYGVLLTLDDVTSQEALETTRQKFISNVSHELKTPVTALRIAAENLQEEMLSDTARASSQSILRSLDRLTLLLDDLSELSRIESGAMTLTPAWIDLEGFVATLMKDLELRALASGITLTMTVEAAPGVRLHTDPHRLQQILDNLVSNALKFSPRSGAVRLSVRVTEQGHAWEVRDEGPGIPAGEQGRIFERFYRAQGAKAKPGTGLGLAIVKHLCRLMGGEVTVESRPGAGAAFRVLLPTHMPVQDSAGPPSR